MKKFRLALTFGLTLTALAWSANGDSDEASSKAVKPATLPDFDTLNLYSATSPLNQKIPANPTIDPNSAGYVGLIAQVQQQGGFAIEFKQYNMTVFFADSTTPLVDVTLACGDEWMGVSTFRDIPIPDFAEAAQDVDGASNPIPPGLCGADADQDNQMVILDLDTRCEFDFWQMRNENGQWVASWGNSISMDSIGIYEKGLSARGSGFLDARGGYLARRTGKGRYHSCADFQLSPPKNGRPSTPGIRERWGC